MPARNTFDNHLPAREPFGERPDARRQPRVASDDLAQIRFGNHLIGCRVHNISPNGAMIEVSTHQVPDQFVLVNYRSKKRMVCKVAWRDNLFIGVKIVSTPKSFRDGFS